MSTAIMNEVLLDEKQASAVTQSIESVPVRNAAGTVLGHIVREDKFNGSAEKELWIERFEEWYFETDEQELKKSRTDSAALGPRN